MTWYESPEGSALMVATLGGKFIFMWEAVLGDGSVLRQFDDFAFQRALIDDEFVPPDNIRLSTDIIPRDKVVEFRLLPIAMTRKLTQHFQQPIVLKLDPEKYSLIARWLVDHDVRSGRKVYRHVIGFTPRDGGLDELTVISPSGKIVQTSTEDLSYEGE